MKSNGLTYSILETISVPHIIHNDEEILDKMPKGSWFIAYLYHRVVIGRIEDKQFVYYLQKNKDVILDNILKLRIFNEDSELFVWKTSLGGYKARLRKDVDVKTIIPDEESSQFIFNEKKQYAIDATQVLFGTEARPVGHYPEYSVLTEQRGTEIVLPLANLKVNDKDGRLCIHTRSYIGFIEETGQASYVDVRFVKFQLYKEDLL